MPPILVSLNASGNASADDRSLKPVFSADGQTLFFQSWASDLSGNDFNNGSDIFALDLAAAVAGFRRRRRRGGYRVRSLCATDSRRRGRPQSGHQLALAAGEAYQVQYKTNLTDAVWLNLPGNATFIGPTGYFSDSLPAPGQRFYRIVLNP